MLMNESFTPEKEKKNQMNGSSESRRKKPHYWREKREWLEKEICHLRNLRGKPGIY